MKIRLAVLVSLASISLSCTEKPVINSRRYSIEVNVWGFGGPSCAAFMYNTGYETYPPPRRGRGQFEPNTLYILKEQKGQKDHTLTDTLKVSLSNEQLDSLYALAHRFVSGFQIDNRVETGEPALKITDGVSLKVALGFNDKLVECSQYHLEGVGRSSTGGRELIEFINKRVKKEFWLR